MLAKRWQFVVPSLAFPRRTASSNHFHLIHKKSWRQEREESRVKEGRKETDRMDANELLETGLNDPYSRMISREVLTCCLRYAFYSV